MTMNDESNLQLLERDLRSLAESRPADELIRLGLREQLATKLRPRPRRRPSLRIALGSAGLAAAGVALAVVALVSTNGPGGAPIADAAIIHHAARAVTPPANKILHVEVMGVQNGMTVAGETWQQTSAPYAFRGLKGEVGHQGEFADNGTTSFRYDPGTNTISTSPDVSRLTFVDPVGQVRQELASGRAHVAGTSVIAGTSLYKIDLPHGLVGYFDKGNYLPRYLDDPQQGGGVVRLRVVAYEYLPMTAANQALLSITAQHPGVRIDRSVGGAGPSK